MSKITCPNCDFEFEVEVRVSMLEPKPRRRWLQAALLLAGLAAVGACAWWVLAR